MLGCGVREGKVGVHPQLSVKFRTSGDRSTGLERRTGADDFSTRPVEHLGTGGQCEGDRRISHTEEACTSRTLLICSLLADPVDMKVDRACRSAWMSIAVTQHPRCRVASCSKRTP